MLFNETIANWSDWGRVFQSIPAFESLVREILRREGLPCAPLQGLTPGTNAVFRSGSYVVKIFCPRESGLDGSADMRTEVFATRLAHSRGVPAPDILAVGELDDRYRFCYIIMDFLGGVEVEKVRASMSRDQKLRLGAQARRLVELMDLPCDDFNGVDVILDENRQQRWKPFCDSFRRERRSYIDSHDFGERVFVHGDLTGDNLPVDGDKLCVIDFADAVRAPICYEHAALVFGMFDCDGAMLEGFYGDTDLETIAASVFDGLLIHDFGGDIVSHEIAPPEELRTLDDLRRRLLGRLKGGKPCHTR